MSNLRIDFDKKLLNEYTDQQIDRILNVAAPVLVSEAKNNALYESGKLRNSITGEVINGNLKIEANVFYAVYVEYLYQPFLRPLVNKFYDVVKKVA